MEVPGSAHRHYAEEVEDGLHEKDLKRVGLFPLPEISLLPGQLLPLHVFEARYRSLVSDVLAGGYLMAVPRLAPGFEHEYHGSPALLPICGVGEIVEHHRRDDGRYDILVRGLGRARIIEELSGAPYRVARLEPLPDQSMAPLTNLTPLQVELKRLVGLLAPHLPEPERMLIEAARRRPVPDHGSDYCWAGLVKSPEARQVLLEERDPAARSALLLQLLTLQAEAAMGGSHSGSRAN